MLDVQFTQLLQNYPDALNDRKRFSGLLKDLMPGMALQANLLLNLFDLNIHEELEKATQISNAFSYRFVKLLCDEYGISKRNADWAVAAWCTCYGEGILKKTVEVEPEAVAASMVSAPASRPIEIQNNIMNSGSAPLILDMNNIPNPSDANDNDVW